jgi:hypothetical protein
LLKSNLKPAMAGSRDIHDPARPVAGRMATRPGRYSLGKLIFQRRMAKLPGLF